MDRLTLALATLAVMNVGLAAWERGQVIPSIDELRARSVELEKALPARERAAAWVERMRPVVAEGVQDDAAVLLSRLRTLGTASRFEIAEAANRGGEPANVVLTGQGPYHAVCSLLEELDRNAAVKLDRLGVTRSDDASVEARFEFSVRSGPWVGVPTQALCEPATAPPSLQMGGGDPFDVRPRPVAQPRQQPHLRFVGYYEGKGGATAIVEDGMRVVLAGIGDRLPGGQRLINATANQIEVQDERGGRWTYRMER